MVTLSGIYELPEVSRYLYVTAPEKPPRYTAVHRWVSGQWIVHKVEHTPEKRFFLSFEDLVSLRMVVALRIAGFSLQHIRKVHSWLVEATNYPHPFALRDLWISDSEIFTEMESRLLSATKRGQYAMDFIKDWLLKLRKPLNTSLDLTFTKVNGKEIASKWMPHPNVVLNPHVQFGSPCIENTRIPTKAVWSMFLGGDTPKSIAMDYGVVLSKIQSAIDWEKKVAGVTS